MNKHKSIWFSVSQQCLESLDSADTWSAYLTLRNLLVRKNICKSLNGQQGHHLLGHRSG